MEKETFKCRFCGKEADASIQSYYVRVAMLRYQLCFNCSFWYVIYKENKIREKYTHAIIDGEHYILDKHIDTPCAGFGGKEFTIKFFDGTIVKCNNLRHQGKIPERFKTLLKDNAEFITK